MFDMLCPVCKKPQLNSSLNPRKDIFVVSYFPYVHPTTGVMHLFDPEHEKILTNLFTQRGIDTIRVAFLSVWMHPPGGRRGKLQQEIYSACEKKFHKEFENKKFQSKGVLLYGAEVTKKLTDYKVSEVTGLQIENSPITYACESAGKTIGETSLAVKRFSNAILRQDQKKME